MSLPVAIDCQYTFPEYAASFLLIEANEAAFIENNTARAVPLLLNALTEKSIPPEQVRYLIVTHVHLDHAGGTYELLRHCPNAEVLAHPKAAPHLLDPKKLTTGVKAVYGEDLFQKLYGSIQAIPKNRVRVMAEGENLSWGRRTLSFFDTKGHANHHFCIFDSSSNGVFTGDSFGLSYPRFKGRFIFPSTSPTGFDPAQARVSYEKILKTKAQRAYFTHFGEVTDLRAARAQLERHLDFHEALLSKAVASPLDDVELDSFCEKELHDYFSKSLEQHLLLSDENRRFLELDIRLNAMGVGFAARRIRHPLQPPKT